MSAPIPPLASRVREVPTRHAPFPQSQLQPAIRVAVIIPILNEARTLGQTLQSLVQQDYPHELIEVLIVDGGSEDDWPSAVTPEMRSQLRIRSLANPRRTTAAAVNIALRETEAEAILWLSGHSPIAPGYISSVVADYEKHPQAVIGGWLDVAGYGVAGTLNAGVLTSRFGTGMAPLRFARKPGWTESVTFALYDRRTLRDIGGLDERLVRNQDTDIWERLRAHGVRFRRVDSPATYLAPATFTGFYRRAFNNGRWNIWGQRIRRGGLSWWHFAPMAMVGGGVLLSVAALWSSVALVTLAVLAGFYLSIGTAEAIRIGMRRGPLWSIPLLPFAFLAHHVIYGLGSWAALLSQGGATTTRQPVARSRS